MNLKAISILIIGTLILVIGGLIYLFFSEKNVVAKITTFEECAQNGFPVQESAPRVCATPDGRTFTEAVKNPNPEPTQPVPNPTTPTTTPTTHELITVTIPARGLLVTSPLTVTGQARGFWYFEASFPVELHNEKNEKIATGIAQAQGEWMTENFVPFSAVLTFKNPVQQNGTLVFRKDNASGLPEHDDQFVVPVIIGVSN